MKKCNVFFNSAPLRLCAIKKCVAAFTLLEVLVSMVILSMMIVVVGNMYQQVSDSWNIGVDRAEILNSGRAALELMAREMSSAVCSEDYSFEISYNTGPQTYYGETDEIEFATLIGDPDISNPASPRRAVVFIRYRISRETLSPGEYQYNLMRRYGKTAGTGGSDVMIQDVADFQIFAYNDGGDPYFDSSDNDHQLPAYVDIYLEVLGSVNARRASRLSGQDQTEFVNRNAKRFSTRVYFNNRNMDFQ